MTINIQGTGNLKKYIPESNQVTLSIGASVIDLIEILGIDESVKAGINLNGKMVKPNHVLSDGDHVILIMLVSAG